MKDSEMVKELGSSGFLELISRKLLYSFQLFSLFFPFSSV
jgi:hypothetical protein